MLGVRVTVPIACFRKGLAREYLETEPLPPPSSCYGFLLSLVGETQRSRHIGCRVAPVLINCPDRSVVLRTVWRCKDKNYWVDPTGKHHLVSTTKRERDTFLKWVESQGWPEPDFKVGLGSGTNARPDYQQLLSGIELVFWLDSVGERNTGPTLEERVRTALLTPARIDRFGGLCLGESTHLVDEVQLLEKYLHSRRCREQPTEPSGQAFLLADRGRLTLPVWVDHVGSAGTRYVTGDLVEGPLEAPMLDRMSRIAFSLPNVSQAEVPLAKVTHYLLSETHRDGRHKAAFFFHFGFHPGQPDALADALREHALRHGVVAVEPSPFGERHVIEGPLETPSQRQPGLRSVWFFETDQDVPRFVTAYPLKGESHD